jgi:hypothetical protein
MAGKYLPPPFFFPWRESSFDSNIYFEKKKAGKKKKIKYSDPDLLTRQPIPPTPPSEGGQPPSAGRAKLYH